MSVFIAISIAAFILVAGSFLFGHDHDAGHDGDVGGDSEPTISIFSTKVLATLLMGFGAAGAIATDYGISYLMSSLIGLGCGVLLGGVMYLIMGFFYSQQSTSLVPTDAAVGCSGRVTVSIVKGGQGEVGLQLNGQYTTLLASANDGGAIEKGQPVTVVKTMGSQVVVERG
jgi:hypothetical protein